MAPYKVLLPDQVHWSHLSLTEKPRWFHLYNLEAVISMNTKLYVSWKFCHFENSLPKVYYSMSSQKWASDSIYQHLSSFPLEKNMETIYWTCGGVANMVNIINVRLNSFFLGSHNSQEVTLPRKSQFLGSNIFWEVTFLGKSLALYWQTQCHPCFSAGPVKVKYAGKSNFLGSHISKETHISWEVLFPRKSHFLWKNISLEVKFPGNHIYWKFTFYPEINFFPEFQIFPGNHFWEFTFPGTSHFPWKLTSSRNLTCSSRNFKFSREITF